MKKILFIGLLFFVIAIHVSAQQTLLTVTKSRTAFDNSGDSLHKIANEFSTAVGDALKENYPARVDDFSLDVSLIWNSWSGYTLTYSARIVRATAQNFQKHFDHRGSLSNSPINAKALGYEQYLIAVSKFEKTYGKMIESSFNHATQANGFFLWESFIMAP